MGCSSRISYYRSGEGVPFKWEMQPGVAKEPQKEELVPPLTPPPAILSMGLPKPSIMDPEEETSSTRYSRLRFWKKRVKRGKSKKKKQTQDCFNNKKKNEDVSGFDMLARLEFCSSDSESVMASPRGSSFSSSSSSSSLSLVKSRPSLQSSACSESPMIKQVYGGRPLLSLGCFPLHVSRVSRYNCMA